MELINLTPHKVVIWEINDHGQGFAEYPSQGVARVIEKKSEENNLASYSGMVKTHRVSYTNVENLPDPTPGVGYIVSIITAQACARMGRTQDIFYPGDLLRDENGKIVGCGALYQIG